jgi:hypothetical protein
VYLEEATCTFYDSPIIIQRLASDFYGKGKCGNPGGFCSDGNYLDEVECKCPEKQVNSFGVEVCAKTSNKWTSVFGNMITIGETFKPFGYGIGFRREKGRDPIDFTPPSWHIPFSQAIVKLRSDGFVQYLENIYIPTVDELQCAQPPEDPSEGDTILQVVNVLGLFYITGAVALVAGVLGQLEALVRCAIGGNSGKCSL